MELKEGTDVFTSNGEQVGKINRIVLDPITNEVTHIVVQKGWLLPEDKVVPFEMINSATEERVVLNEDIDDFEQLPPFEETHFISAPAEDIGQTRDTSDPDAPAYHWYPPPYGYIGYPAYGLGYSTWPPVETLRNIPEDTIPLKEGTKVLSFEGEHVGDVDRLFIEPDSGRATYFLISQGLLFKDQKLVPVNWVRSVEEDEVHLGVSSRFLEHLPAYKSE